MYGRKCPPSGVKMNHVISLFVSKNHNVRWVNNPPKTKIEQNMWVLSFFYGKLQIAPSHKPKKVKKLSQQEWIDKLKRDKPNSFYLTDKWRNLKKRVLRLYGVTCMKCGATNTVMHVDHIKPRSKRPDLEMDINNLQVLCKGCNMDKGNTNDIDYRSPHHLQKLILSQNTKGGY